MKHSRRRQLEQLLLSRDSFVTTREWFDAVATALEEDKVLEPETLELLELRIRGPFGHEQERIGGEHDEHIRFWLRLAEQFPDEPNLVALAADTMLLQGRTTEAMDHFLQAFASKPELVYRFGGEIRDFMREQGGDRWLRYQLVLVVAALATGNEEYAKDLYSQLLEEHRNDEDALRKVRALARGRLYAGGPKSG